MLAILEGNFEADNETKQKSLDEAALPSKRKQELDAELQQYTPGEILHGEADIDTGYAAEQENKYLYVKKAVEELERAESLEPEFEQTHQELEQAKEKQRRLYREREQADGSDNDIQETEKQLAETKQEINECLIKLNKINARLGEAINRAEKLWEKADINETERLFVTDAIDGVKDKLFSLDSAKKSLKKIDDKFSQILEIKSLGKNILDIKRYRDHSGKITNTESGKGDSQGDELGK